MKRMVAGAAWLLLSVAVSETWGQAPIPLKPKNLETLNTEKDEDDPHLASDGLHLYYSSNRQGKMDILVAQRPKRGQPWQRGKLVEGYIQTKADDKSAFVTPEDKFPQYLYFATKKDLLPDANFDIFVAVRQGPQADFTAPTPINSISSAADELHPWLTNDGKSLFFSRATGEGWRMFVTTRAEPTGSAGFGEPKRVELPVGFHHPTITPNGKTMYLQGKKENGRWGLFRAKKNTKGWDKPEPLTALNSDEGALGDQSPNLSRDGVILYFASDRPGGKGGLDLYWVLTEDLEKAK